jgi:hypothetical protein
MGALVEVEKRRAQILRLQDEMQNMPNRLDLYKDAPVRHIFAPGCYAREMTLPEGSCIIGKIHRHAHINIISAGHVRVATDEGVLEFRAPYTFVSQPGTKRVVLALENTIWTTIHPTEETDLGKIEEQVIAPSYMDLPQLEGKK